MSYLEVQDLSVRFGNQPVLHDVSFTVEPGERLCLLGPSGCGKTTSLRVIAGFVMPDSGRVTIAGKDMQGVAPERRNIGILFQNYALFPHLTAYDNVAFGLRMRGLAEGLLRQKVHGALDLVRLPEAAGKRPAQLSGGEQQRIAFARAIVIEPSLLLLDEPFSNLDARLRQEMRGDLLELLQQLHITTVLVTHDQEEAMSIADRIVVMRTGRIEQVGPPTEIYERPQSLFVARFLGESNVFPGVARATRGGLSVEVDGFGALVAESGPGMGRTGPVRVLVRPEKVRVLGANADPVAAASQRVAATVERVQYLGHRTEYRLRAGRHSLMAWRLNETPAFFRAGDPVIAEWATSETLVFPDEGPG